MLTTPRLWWEGRSASLPLGGGQCALSGARELLLFKDRCGFGASHRCKSRRVEVAAFHVLLSHRWAEQPCAAAVGRQEGGKSHVVTVVAGLLLKVRGLFRVIAAAMAESC